MFAFIGCDEMFAAGHLLCRTDEFDFHMQAVLYVNGAKIVIKIKTATIVMTVFVWFNIIV